MSTDAPPTKATAQDVLATLQSIDAHLRALVEIAQDTAEHQGVYVPKDAPKPQDRSTVPDIAPDRDLDGQYGNPEIKAKDPRDWSGDTMKGKRFSECPPAYLDLVADRLMYFAERLDGSDEGEDLKKARFNRLDASRARGWAARLRAGWTPPPVEPSAFGDGPPLSDDDIPFAWLMPFVLPAIGMIGAAFHYAA